MEVSVNEAKLTDLWATNCVRIQKVLISKSAFGPEKLPGLSRNGPLEARLEMTLRSTYYLYGNFAEKFSSHATGIFVGTETGTELSFTI